MDNKTKILIGLPFALIIVLLIAANYFPFKDSVSETENQALAFMAASLSIKEQPDISVSGEMKIPMDFSAPSVASRVEKQAAEEDALVKEIDYNESHLSLVVISGKRKMAIINGSLVREGENFGDMKIARIEADRVLIKNKTEKWLYLEKTK